MSPFEIGKAIRTARKSLNLTQQDVATKAGMSVSTISLIENGMASEIGLRKLTMVMDIVGLEIIASQRRMGWTLDDANEDLRRDALKLK
jgi:transcriptional regulator with XRE-family HTH domain